ncbi:MAG TPA: hypothetical protein VF070_24490 [Streptosporangiaceae bacterium]
MTTATVSLRRRVSGDRTVPWAGAGRLVTLESRRNVTRFLLPLFAVLFWFDTYRTGTGYPALWGLRTQDLILHHMLPDLVPFLAGAAAWTAAREGRRHTADLVEATARPGWARQSAALAAVVGWAMAAYLVCVGVVLWSTAAHATWGGPPLWPVIVGAAEVAAVCTVGFSIGSFLPGRLIVPLTVLGIFFVQLVGFKFADSGNSPYALLSPTTRVPPIDIGVFYAYLPDLSIAQTMFLAGVAIAAAGVLGMPAGSGGRRLRRAAAVTTVAGLAVAATAVGLAGTAEQGAQGVIIPALHDSASDRPVPYTPACGQAAGVPVCVHPAFSFYLPEVTAAVRRVLAEVAGLPGVSARLSQAPTSCVRIASLGCGFGHPAATIGGSPAVLSFTIPTTPGAPGVGQGVSGEDLSLFEQQTRAVVTTALTGGGLSDDGALSGAPAQQAIAAAMLQAAGVPVITPAQAQADDTGIAGPPPGSPSYLAFKRFAALPAVARRAWLAAHLDALRAGRVTLNELP